MFCKHCKYVVLWDRWHEVQGYSGEKAKCAMGNQPQEEAESVGQFSWDRFGLMCMLLRAGYQIAVFSSKLWEIKQKITTLAVSGKMHCKLMETKDMILRSIWYSYNQCCAWCKDLIQPTGLPLTKTGFGLACGTDWDKLTDVGLHFRFQLVGGHCELSLKAQLKG